MQPPNAVIDHRTGPTSVGLRIIRFSSIGIIYWLLAGSLQRWSWLPTTADPNPLRLSSACRSWCDLLRAVVMGCPVEQRAQRNALSGRGFHNGSVRYPPARRLSGALGDLLILVTVHRAWKLPPLKA